MINRNRHEIWLFRHGQTAWNVSGQHTNGTTANMKGFVPRIFLEKRPGWTIWNDGVPGGEAVEQVGDRARKVVALTKAVDGDVAVFSHSHLLRILAACWLGLPPDAGRYFDLNTASVSVLGYSGDAPVIRRWNQDLYVAVAMDE